MLKGPFYCIYCEEKVDGVIRSADNWTRMGKTKETQLWVSIKYASSDTCLTSRNLVQISVDLKTCPPIPSRALSSCLIRMAR